MFCVHSTLYQAYLMFVDSEIMSYLFILHHCCFLLSGNRTWKPNSSFRWMARKPG